RTRTITGNAPQKTWTLPAPTRRPLSPAPASPISGVLERGLSVVEPEPVLSPDLGAAVHPEVSESRPGHREARGAARHQQGVDRFGEIALDVCHEGPPLLNVLLHARLFDQSIDLRVA